MLPKLILTDIDGVWTDGGMYYDEHGNEFKKFNTYDSAGVLFCKMLGIPCGLVTGENANSVKRRGEKLKMEHIYLGVKDKVDIIGGLAEELGVEWGSIAYLGDDINDYHVLKRVGLSACPSSAPEYIRKVVKWKLTKKGGEGVFREFIEKILVDNGISIEQLIENNASINKKNIQ
ncbi:acylneuraminate cytidylyltransferase [Flagellimonas aquimarina]|uniref:Acylneuraminate cytidylyltransferase n=1 Tax=Flagellimonas aquimarina TaxID=2201895 RepID=A0A316L4J9_9FLAO|nr:HAD-IIIA family hydrolase [Allomuricauda koreensis]PWL39849.1 acylneuraminate cytidylyltransferase [Allomuricauda koreensis]